MLRLINPKDEARIISLWRECFGDSEAYIRQFWSGVFLPGLCRGVAAEEDGRVVSMQFLLPGRLERGGGVPLPAAYVYAVCTATDCRGRGHAAALTEYAAALARGEKAAALCLFPAEPGLEAYYARLGFVPAFARARAKVARHDEMIPYLKTNAGWNAETAVRQRAARWGGQGLFAWDAPLLEYMRRAHLALPGARVRCGENGYVFYALENGTLTIKELCAPPEEENALLHKVMRISGAELAHIIRAAEPGDEPEPGGMLLPLDERAKDWLAATRGNAYLGFTME
ncbi:MAG: GNAT family N-acetyltransferase [Oscillospiraceae bacterium]|nr:GNAT family N-acetyltransferase [Oscillospiraceae bacterium]